MAEKAICPRCGNPKASANARGPNHIWCGRCRGLIQLDAKPEREGPVSDDPVRNAIYAEHQARASRLAKRK